MKNIIKVTATIAKTTIDAKKAVVTLELEPGSWSAVPKIATLTGETMDVELSPIQERMDV